MTSEIQYYDHNDYNTVLSLSQKASSLLSKSSLKTKSQLLSVISAVEEPTEWADLEQVFIACLRAGDDAAAHQCLQRLSQRFGGDNHRIMALRGLYQEAVAKNEEDLRRVLQEYNQIIKEDPMNIAIHKRRTSLIRAVGKPADALECLVQFLTSFPADVEAWCELSDLYMVQGMIPQAIFCLEEALVNSPNAWNLHARLGEVNYLASQSSSDGVAASDKHLAEAVRRFARSVELCQDYVRGYYGLKMVTDKLSSSNTTKSIDGLSNSAIQQLNQTASAKLRQIVKKSSQMTGPRKAEIIAAQALLDAGT